MEACIFCRIVRREAPAYIAYEDDDVIVFLDILPVEKGHLLVVSKEHYESIHDADPRVVAKVFVVAGALTRIYREIHGAPGVNIITNSGKKAGQEVFHFHVHVIPRWKGGGWRALTKRHPLTREEAEEVLGMIRPHQSVIQESLRKAGLF